MDSAQRESRADGFAVRADWRDGSHTYSGWRPGTEIESVIKDREKQNKYWRKGPIRPTLTVVAIDAETFTKHDTRGGCKSPECPAVKPPACEVVAA